MKPSLVSLLLFAFSFRCAFSADVLFQASFDESAQPEKSAADSVASVPEGGRPRFVPGVRGNALVVGAKSWVRYPVVGNILPDKGSIAFLAKPIGWNGNDNLVHFFVSAQAGSGDWLIVYKTPENKFLFTGGNAANYSYAETPAENWKDGQWKHICVTWDNGVACLYFDGALAGTRKWPVVAESFGNEFVLGGTIFGESKEEQALDELTIYNAALPTEEVAAIYSKHKSAMEKVNAESSAAAKKKL
ncbi:MAG: LamG domain-containing protein [Verrucomicrobia bacterium]|nr:LamG domain-containing protein [Verrucomicrobiota bacterium]